MAVILITGASGGIGSAIARKYDEASDGHQFILCGRNAEKLTALKNSLKSKAEIAVFDICDDQKMASEISRMMAQFGGIDILINNAGLALGKSPAYDCDWQDWETMIMTNVRALTRLTHLILPSMVQNNKGHIINIGSVAGNYPYSGGHVYCATKAYVGHFSQALRGDLIHTNVRVTSIEPGLVETDFSMVRFKGDQKMADAVYAGKNPLLPEDIADTVFFATQMPGRASITRLEIMATSQAPGGFSIHQSSK